MQRIVYLERESVSARVRRPAFPTSGSNHPATRPEEVAGRLAGAAIAITNKAPLTRDVIAALPEPPGGGGRHRQRGGSRRLSGAGIVVCNIRGYARDTIPEHVFALLLALSRNLFAGGSPSWRGTGNVPANSVCSTIPSATCAAPPSGWWGAAAWAWGSSAWARPSVHQVLRAEHKGTTTVRPGYTPLPRYWPRPMP